MSVDAFQHYWRHEHAKVITQLPGIRRYVQSHSLRECAQGKDPVYDGIAELWANDSRAFQDIAGSEAYAAVQADEVKFLDRTAIALVLTDGHIIKDGCVTAHGVKRIQLFNRRKGLPVEEFQNYWRNCYGPLLAGLPMLDRYVQYHARLGGYAHGRQPAHDGFDVSWFKSMDGLRCAVNSDVYDRGRSEQKNFLATDYCSQILAREYVIKEADHQP